MQKERVDIAVVMVSYNEIEDGCLQSLQKAMDASALNVSFVLVDNASTELDAHSYAKRHMKNPIVILRNKNSGFGSASNRGAREVEADYYFFLNPDTKIEDNHFFDKLYGFMQKYPKVGIAAPRIVYMDGRLQETCRRFPAWYMPFVRRTGVAGESRAKLEEEFLMNDFDHKSNRIVDWVQGSAFMIDASLFYELGGFDDRYFMYYEDVDLCRGCWDKGRPVYYLPEVEIKHIYRQGSASKDGVVMSLLKNRLARAHVVSWIKYSSKWLDRQI